MKLLDAHAAVQLVQTTDSIAVPLGPGQPVRFLEALGERDDWEDLRIYGALMTVLSNVFMHPNVHYLSGFFGPIERGLRDAGANLGFAPADFRRFEALLKRQPSRIVATAATPPDTDGYCSLSLHAGAHIGELARASADPERLVVVEASPNFPRTHGYGDHKHRLHVDEIDVLVESDATPLALNETEPSDVERRIAAHIAPLVRDGATLQTGIGGVPSAVASLLAEGDGGDYGVHSEMFTTGLMRLHKAGKVTNRCKGQFQGVSVTTFSAGSAELYEWLDDNREVAFLPVSVVNNPDLIAANENMVTINSALAVDIHGQVVADTRDGGQYSGIGGHEDFVQGPGLDATDRSILCLPATYRVGEEVRSRLVPYFGPGTVITTPRHHVDLIATEYGIAELQGKTVHQRGLELASVAHPDFRDALIDAAKRASKGRSTVG